MEHNRTCHFSISGGPSFKLTTWRSHIDPENNRKYLAYRLYMCLEGKSTVLFKGNDYSPPRVAPNSDESMSSLMGFLTLAPGDADDDYFQDYTKEQLDYCENYAEDLSEEVLMRFEKEEDDNG